MGLIDEIMQMKSQGVQDLDIVNSLQQEGYSPKDINDALSQAQIKTAVANEGIYSPQTQELQEAPQPESYGTQEYYPQQDYYSQGYSPGTDTDSMMEIAEQVFMEKIKTIQNQIEKLEEFKTIAETKIDNTEERLKRIESIIDRFQAAVIEKIGSYGDNLDSIKKEVGMVQDSFEKLMRGSSATIKTEAKKVSKK